MLSRFGVGKALMLVAIAALTGGAVSLALGAGGATSGAGQGGQAAAAERYGPDGARGEFPRFRRLSPAQRLARRKQFHAELAKELGVSTAAVDRAFRNVLKKHLDQDVAQRRLTRKQADALLECYDTAKCKPPFRRGLRRFRGPPPPVGAPPMMGPAPIGPSEEPGPM